MILTEEFYLEGKKELLEDFEKLKVLETKLKRKCENFKLETVGYPSTMMKKEILHRFQKLPKAQNEK